ncbi:hypothetical protein D9611_010429 [Ephemerocybe angulata]|uniref:Uncharacterized protein n=1 Tax=Ephemerocybe angulata TaxID=980116 RepID=A0A8H5FAP5_9AGAR|nr:hypothetical protein D9611_010429 [Tulosesus angulatus]
MPPQQRGWQREGPSIIDAESSRSLSQSPPPAFASNEVHEPQPILHSTSPIPILNESPTSTVDFSHEAESESRVDTAPSPHAPASHVPYHLAPAPPSATRRHNPFLKYMDDNDSGLESSVSGPSIQQQQPSRAITAESELSAGFTFPSPSTSPRQPHSSKSTAFNPSSITRPGRYTSSLTSPPGTPARFNLNVPVNQGHGPRARKNTASLEMKKAAMRRASAVAQSDVNAALQQSEFQRPHTTSGTSSRRALTTNGVAWPTTTAEENEGEGEGDMLEEDDMHTESATESVRTLRRRRTTSYYPSGCEGPRCKCEDEDLEEQEEMVEEGELEGQEPDLGGRDMQFRGGDLGHEPQVAEMDRASARYANLAMEKEIPHLRAVTTRIEYERYKRGYVHPVVASQSHIIEPFKTSFHAPRAPEGWKVFVHPEGTRYFYCDSPENPVPVLTEAWIYDQEIYTRLQDYMGQIFDYMKRNDIDFPRPPKPTKKRGSKERKTYPQDIAPVVLVLEFRLTGRIGYYFVSHTTQTLFWLDPFDFGYMLGEVHVEQTEWLVGLQMRSHYWYHNDLFPHLYELSERDLGEADDFVGYGIGDVVTSAASTTEPRDLNELKFMQGIVHRYEGKKWERRRMSHGERRVICRLLSEFYHERFINLYGERGARLNLTQSIHYSPHRRQKWVEASTLGQHKPWWTAIFGSSTSSDTDSSRSELVAVDADPVPDPAVRAMAKNSLWMTLLSIVMFGSPTMHMRRLRDMTVDEIVSKHTLAKFAEKMVEEWRDITLYGTVVLTANVSFLTIQSVDSAGAEGPKRSDEQRASYFSILASMGTIVFSLLLLRQHREAMNLSFVAHRSVSRWGLESLALMYALPFALLIWSMISFFASFAIMWFKAKDYVVIIMVAAACFIFFVFLLWAISAAYEKEPYESYAAKAARRAEGMGHKIKEETSKAVQSAKNRLSAPVEPVDEEHRRSGSSMTVTGAEALPAYSAEARAMHKRKGSKLLVVGDWLGSLGHRKRDSTIEDGVANGGVSEKI